jgi:1,4-dihydroxy-2-naphthoyl-CoA hydrolase
MSFVYARTVRLADTDAAGVVFFARTLAICHEAYEAALAAAGIDLHDLLGAKGIVVPISRSEADYKRPLRPGDKLRVTVAPELLSDKSFAIRFEVTKLGPPEKLAATVRTEHVCTAPAKRERAALPPALAAWAKAG